MLQDDDLERIFGDLSDADGPPLTDAMVEDAEAALGYRLPESFVRLLQLKNGGSVEVSRVPTDEPTSWADDHVSFHHVMGIGYEGGIDGDAGSAYLIEEWGYPEVGVVIASDGETAIMLDYSAAGPEGEPRVVWVDVDDDDPEVIELAPDFDTFLEALVEEEDDEEDEDEIDDERDPDDDEDDR